MRLRTRKLLTPELATNGAQPSDKRSNEPQENTPAGEAQENSDGSMNRDSQVVSAALGGYAFPAPSRYDDDSWDSDTMLVVWAPWFNSAALEQENICLLYTSPSPRDQRGSRMPSSA